MELSTLLKQSDILLNNVDLNPVEPQAEFLVTSRSKNSYLIKLTDPPQIAQVYDSIDDVRWGRFSQCGQFIYTLTRTGTLNVFNKLTAKLISKLRKNQQSGISDSKNVDEEEVEIDGMLGCITTQNYSVGGGAL